MDNGHLVLQPSMEAYILHWGEMGNSWGVNRTVAQIHALLWIWHEPLDAECIATTLNIARSNVSASLKELREWGLVESKPVLGQRREHFTTEKDPFLMMLQVIAERRRRELEPTAQALQHCATLAASEDAPESKAMVGRLTELADLVDSLLALHGRLQALPPPVLKMLLKSGGLGA